MDIIRYLNIFAIISPFIYAVFLFVNKISLINVNKKILNNGLILINLLSLIVFGFSLFCVFCNNYEANLILPFIKYDNFLLNIEFIINKTNIAFLFYCSILAFIFSIYFKFYFKKFKKYIFEKQGFLNLFAFSIFVLYLFILSANLFTLCVFWILLTMCVYLLSVFDLFKNNTNTNIARFSKIALIGDFSFLFALVLFLKSTLAQSEACSCLKIVPIFLTIAYLVRFKIFPFMPYSTFLASSSNLLYLTAICFINTISALFLFKNTLNNFELSFQFNLIVYVLSLITVICSLIFVLFEKNIKIIFGYLIALINAFFVSLYLGFQNDILIFIYLFINLLISSILAYVFYKDKIEFSKRLIPKQKDFILEKIYIIIFEKLPLNISNLLDFADKKIIQNIMSFLILCIDFVITKIFLKFQKFKTCLKLKYILMLFAFVIIFAILTALFGGVNVK